jgi:uncharacterized sulfatase
LLQYANPDHRSMRTRNCVILVVAFLSAICHVALAETAARPNVLFIVVDDLCCDLGCYGEDAKTPNIDRLAARGVRFDRAYCQWPVCNASRTSFLTGLRPDQTGIFENLTPFRTKLPDVVTLPQLFRQQGYFTAGLGKVFHAGIDASGKRVFFQDAKSWDDCRNYEATALGKKGEGRNVTDGAMAVMNWLAAEGGDEDQPDGQLAAAAVKIIESRREKPLFLAVGFHKPHDPFHAPKEYFELYPPDQIKLHQPPADRTEDLPAAVSRQSPVYKLAGKNSLELHRAYLACTSFMDAQVGKLFDALSRLQLWDNTIVVFIGDHGYHQGQHDWWLKFTLFERCARVPLIVWAPQRKGMGQSARGIVELVDLYPTLVDLAGIEPPAGVAGRSFRPLLDDPAQLGKQAAFTQVERAGGGRTVRTDRWRYTEWRGGAQGVELYDHSADPEEYHNLAGRPETALIERELKYLLHNNANE